MTIPKPDYVRALAILNATQGPGEALEEAYTRGDLEPGVKLTPGLIELVRTYNALVRGTDLEVPQSVIDLLELSLEAARSGNLEGAKSLYESATETVDPDFYTRLEARAAHTRHESAGAGSENRPPGDGKTEIRQESSGRMNAEGQETLAPETLTVAELVARMRDAYKKTQTYLSVTTTHMVNLNGGWDYRPPSEELFAFDRSRRCLRSEYARLKPGSDGTVKKEPVSEVLANRHT